MSNLSLRIARALIEIGAVRFTPREPVMFKSGLLSPVYVDNRCLPFWPEPWHLVILGLEGLITTHRLRYDVIAGIETAGIPHSAALAYRLQAPSVFVRKATKEHGARRRVEGGDVTGRRVLLIEDHVTTGGSSLAGVFALREEGAEIPDCLAITSYGFPEAGAAFDAAGVNLRVLVPFDELAGEAYRLGAFDADDLAVLADWSADPHGWAARQGLT